MKYIISYKEPHKHFADFELHINKINSSATYIQIPAWRPGRYELQNFARNIQKLEMFDENGAPVAFRKVSRERWEADTSSVRELVVKYKYYCAQMDAGGCWVDEHQIYLNFIGCALYAIGLESEPCTIFLSIPDTYKVACGLPSNGKELHAQSYFHLVDSPMIASPDLREDNYEVGGATFHMWFQGDIKPDWGLIKYDFIKFTEENLKVFGDFPEKDYHFMFQIVPFRLYHGVEHRNSTVITLGPAEIFHTQPMYENFLGISCHELFHAWNALKIRPKELMPYDFTRENYFRTGYVIEGVTTYYGDLLLKRSGVFSVYQYFNEINCLFKKHFENFGRFNLSLAESSFDLWIDGYIAGIPNRKVSIYVKGAIAAMILDLEIRMETGSERSLDDVMKHLWLEYGKKNEGYSEADYQNAIEQVTGKSFKKYFDECIYGKDPIEDRLNLALQTVGCQLSILPNQTVCERVFGFRVIMKEGKSYVDLLEPGSPADAILTKDDEIISIDGVRVDNNLCELLWEKDSAMVTFTRSGKTQSLSLRSDNRNHLNQYMITKNELANPEQKLNFKKWLNSDH